MGVLDQILAKKREEIARLRSREAQRAIRDLVVDAPTPRDFSGALRRSDGRVAVIAELKRRSPSKGDLAPSLDPAATATAYAAGGAAALSVLTDGPYFGGSGDDLRAAREATHLPVLRKDFTLDPAQVVEARAIGADAVLLIAVALPDDGLLRDLLATASEHGMAALVEAHDAAELDRALAVGARIVGVNSRSLQDFSEDLGVAAGLAERIPPEVVAVGESAVRSPVDAERLAAAGYDAVLVGEALVRSDDPESLCRALGAAPVHRRGP